MPAVGTLTSTHDVGAVAESCRDLDTAAGRPAQGTLVGSPDGADSTARELRRVIGMERLRASVAAVA